MQLLITDTQVVEHGTGGGQVCFHEAKALKDLYMRNKGNQLGCMIACNIDPNKHDTNLIQGYTGYMYDNNPDGFNVLKNQYIIDYLSRYYLEDYFSNCAKLHYDKICLFNGSGFYWTSRYVQEKGLKIVADVPAHNLQETIQEHVRLYGKYPYTNLIDLTAFKFSTHHIQVADLILCPSEIAKRNLLAIPRLKSLNPEKIKVISHGCEPVAALGDYRQQKPLKFLYVGQAGPDKGLIYLFQAWQKCAFPPEQASLHIAGDGTKEFLKSIPIPNITAYGRVSESELNYLYNTCDVYVQPSVTEAFGIPVLEAMGHGLPVIVSEGAGVSELINEKFGFKFPVRDVNKLVEHLQYFVAKPDTIEVMGKLAYKESWNYAWSGIEHKIRDALAELV